MKSRGFLPTVLAGLRTAIEWSVTVIVGTMVLNIAGGVFFRYVLRDSLYWTEELGRYLMVWAGFLGAALAMAEDSHVGISFVVELFPVRAQRVLKLLARLTVSVFLALILLKSFAYLGSLSIQTSSALGLPMVVPYLSVIVGVILMSIENLVHIARLFAKAEQPGDGK